MIVVAAVDGSDQTHKVVQAAADYAKDAEIHFVHVAESYIYPYMVANGQMVDFEGIKKREREEVWNMVGRLPPGAQQVELEGSPATTIVGYSKNVKADLIIVGSRGRGALGSLILGSVSHGVIHGSSCNVLVVR